MRRRREAGRVKSQSPPWADHPWPKPALPNCVLTVIWRARAALRSRGRQDGGERHPSFRLKGRAGARNSVVFGAKFIVLGALARMARQAGQPGLAPGQQRLIGESRISLTKSAMFVICSPWRNLFPSSRKARGDEKPWLFEMLGHNPSREPERGENVFI
jgi:hypothetical protein